MKNIIKADKDKDLECRQCASFFNYDDLIDGACPDCLCSDAVFENSIKDK